MCYSGARLVNGLSLPSPYAYLHPPLPVEEEEEEEFIPGLPRLVEDELPYFVPAAVAGPSLFEELLLIGELPPTHLYESIFAEGVVEMPVSRGRAFPGPMPPQPLPPLGHGAGEVSPPAEGPAPGPRGRAAQKAAFMRNLRAIGRSRN